MANPTIQQPEIEDVIMKDASPYESHQGASQSKMFDAMDMNNPTRDYIPQDMNKILPDAGNSLLGINTISLHPPKEMKVPLLPGKLPYNKQFRFSPKSQHQQRSPGLVLPRATDLQSYRMPTTYRTNTTTYAPGLLNDNNHSVNYSLPNHMQPSHWKKWNTSQASSSTSFQPTTRMSGVPKWPARRDPSSSTVFGPITQSSRWNTSRDSSLSSFDTQKSTEDGKENSFDSVTSVSTAQSLFPRKPSLVGRETNIDSLASMSTASSFSLRKRDLGGKGADFDSLSSISAAPSFQQRKRNFDGRLTDFDSVTPLSGAPSPQPRKRPIDNEMKTEESHGGNPDLRSGSTLKYRRVSEEVPSISVDNGETSSADQVPTAAQRTSFSSPSHRILPRPTLLGSPSNIMDPATPVNDSQTGNSTAAGPIPGCWPLTSGSTPYRPDVYISVPGEAAMMSGALAPPQFESPQASSIPHSNAPDSPSDEENEAENTHLTEGGQQQPSTWNHYYATLQGSIRQVCAFQRGMAQTVANAFSGAFAIAGSITQQALALLRHRRTRSRGHSPCRLSPTATKSPVRVNIRTLPAEQQQRVRANQWRKDRGYPIVEEYPFPELSFDRPQIAPILATSIQRGNKVQPTGGFKSITTVERTRKHPARPQMPRNNQGVQRHKAPRAGILKMPRVSPQLKRRLLLPTRGRDRERGRRERQLQVALRTGNFDGFDFDPSREHVSTESNWVSVLGDRQQTSTRSKPKHRVRFQEPLVTVHENQPSLLPELAPHLHPSSPKNERSALIKEEQKENIPPVSVAQSDSVSTTELVTDISVPEVIEPTEPLIEPDRSWVDPWSQPVEFPLGRPVSAVQLFYPTPQPLPPGRTESLLAPVWRKIQEKKKLEEGTERIWPEGPAVRPLSKKWETRVEEAMRMPNNRKIVDTLSGDPLTKRDLATCFTPMAWLNDEVINSYLALVIDYLRRDNDNDGRHDKPRYHAFNSFFFSNLRDKGYDSVRRWAIRAKIGGDNLLKVDTVFIPVHNSAHWTLIVVKPLEQTIEHFDSLGSLSHRHVGIVKSWLRGELGELYVDEDWKVLPSQSPQQDNGSDCGVFLLSTAKAVAINVEPRSYGAGDTRLLRKKIVAELMNGGLEGDFAPRGADGDVSL